MNSQLPKRSLGTYAQSLRETLTVAVIVGLRRVAAWRLLRPAQDGARWGSMQTMPTYFLGSAPASFAFAADSRSIVELMAALLPVSTRHELTTRSQPSACAFS